MNGCLWICRLQRFDSKRNVTKLWTKPVSWSWVAMVSGLVNPNRYVVWLGAFNMPSKERQQKLFGTWQITNLDTKTKNVNRTNPTQDNRIQLKTIFPHCILLAWLVSTTKNISYSLLIVSETMWLPHRNYY